jgi:hypothetical protein
MLSRVQLSRPKEKDVAALVCMIITNRLGDGREASPGRTGKYKLASEGFLGVRFGVRMLVIVGFW